jgi:hypothetical protein
MVDVGGNVGRRREPAVDGAPGVARDGFGGAAADGRFCPRSTRAALQERVDEVAVIGGYAMRASPCCGVGYGECWAVT